MGGVTIRISKIGVSKNKLFYICSNKSCKNIFIDRCESINEIELATRREGGVKDIHQKIER